LESKALALDWSRASPNRRWTPIDEKEELIKNGVDAVFNVLEINQVDTRSDIHPTCIDFEP